MLESICAINASFMLVLSMGLKWRDRRLVQNWMMGIKALQGAGAQRMALALIMVVEGAMLLAVLLWGSARPIVPLTVLTLLCASSGALAVFSKSEKGCPCFGNIFITEKFGASKFVGLFAAISLAAYLLSHVWSHSKVLFLVFLVIELLLAFGLGLRLMQRRYDGKRLQAAASTVRGKDRGVVVFLSTQCHVCMRELRLIEAFSKLFKDRIDFFFVIEGMDLAEDCLFGGGVALANALDLKSRFDVRLSPSIVIYSNDHFLRYTGLHACKAALYESLSLSVAGQVG